MRKNFLCGVFILVLVAGCSTHEVDTFPEWCERITGVDLYKKYAPWWSIIPAVKFNGEAIRDDFVSFLNNAYMEKANGRIEKMVWREGTNLHIVNMSSLFVIEPEKMINEYRQKVQAYWDSKTKDKADICLFGTIATMFDTITIHSIEADIFGKNWKDTPTVIDTLRQEKLKGKGI